MGHYEKSKLDCGSPGMLKFLGMLWVWAASVCPILFSQLQVIQTAVVAVEGGTLSEALQNDLRLVPMEIRRLRLWSSTMQVSLTHTLHAPQTRVRVPWLL